MLTHFDDTSDDESGSNRPETVAKARDVIDDKSFVTPTGDLPDDPAALKTHIEELYVHLTSASTVLNSTDTRREERLAEFEERTAEFRERAEEASARMDQVADNLLGSESDEG